MKVRVELDELRHDLLLACLHQVAELRHAVAAGGAPAVSRARKHDRRQVLRARGDVDQLVVSGRAGRHGAEVVKKVRVGSDSLAVRQQAPVGRRHQQVGVGRVHVADNVRLGQRAQHDRLVVVALDIDARKGKQGVGEKDARSMQKEVL